MPCGERGKIRSNWNVIYKRPLQTKRVLHMNRIGITAATIFGVLFLLATVSFAFAKENESQDNRGQGNISAQLQVQAGTDTERESGSENASSSDSDRNDDNNSDEDVRGDESDDVDTGDDENDVEDEGERHRSVVADIVHSLTALADRDGGIGEEVRKVAQEQASSSEHISEAMARIEARSALMTFLFGADFRNIGELRSELATTQNHIEQLTKVKSEAVSADVKVGIDTQISALKKANADASAFVEAHADTFSIFGWFAKLFGR